MAKKFLTDSQVEEEIVRLRGDEHVRLARAEEAIRYRRRKYLYTLRAYQKKGLELAASGITMEMLEGMEEENKL